MEAWLLKGLWRLTTMALDARFLLGAVLGCKVLAEVRTLAQSGRTAGRM